MCKHNVGFRVQGFHKSVVLFKGLIMRMLICWGRIGV